MKVAGWSTASVILRPSQIQIVPNPKQGTYSGCFGFFFSSYLKARLFPDYNRRSKHHWYFPFTPIPTSPKIPYFFNTFLFWVSRNMQHAMKEKEAVLLLNFQLINKKKQSDYTRVLVVINCELKMHGKFFNALEKFLHHASFFVLFFSVTLQLLRSFWVPHPMGNLVETFFFFWLSAYMQKIYVIQSFHSEIYVIKESCNLQSNWLKAFLATTQ